MKIFSLKEKNSVPCVMALGYFDGVHLGHRKVIEKAVSYAKEKGLVSAVFTFTDKNHSKKDSGNIYSFEYRCKLIEKLGVDFILAADFSEFSLESPKEFIENLLDDFSAEAFTCGEDFRFGKGAAGDINTLKALCEDKKRELFVVDAVVDTGSNVSSTRIREEIKNGNIESANKLLADEYTIFSKVEEGKKIGTAQLVPTLNQSFFENSAIPKFGVYASRVICDGEVMEGITNIGVCPTMKEENIPNAETHIIDRELWLYGKEIYVKLYKFIRPEMKFSSKDELKTQICKDIEEVKSYFKMH